MRQREREPLSRSRLLGQNRFITAYVFIGMNQRLLSLKRLPLSMICILLAGCSPLLEPSKKPKPDVKKFASNPLPPEKAKETIEEVGKGFIYGPGIGEAVVNGGTAVLFPPYAIVLLGNAVLSLSGYEPITVSRMLPDEAGKAWGEAYDGVVSGPGRVSAAIAGEEFRSQELIDTSINNILESSSEAGPAKGGLSSDKIVQPVGRTRP